MSPPYQRAHWSAPAGVHAVFTLRHGGVSLAPYESFNLAAHVGDNDAAVAENRRRLCEALALPRSPLWLEQVHGTGVVDADRLEPAATVPRADAALTREPGTVLAVLVADCLPVLFASQDGGAVGIAHAGWRGLAAGVLEATVAALDTRQPLHAWLGPSIGPSHFEVGEEVRAAFLAHDAASRSAFSSNARGRWQCDLQALARARLAALGVQWVHADTSCSYAQPRRFYSYRRDGVTGRMAALIWLERSATQYGSAPGRAGRPSGLNSPPEPPGTGEKSMHSDA
ncbi:MAG: peptidoglycan editing factor PgeF [Steroidobacteraceae bacterium]